MMTDEERVRVLGALKRLEERIDAIEANFGKAEKGSGGACKCGACRHSRLGDAGHYICRYDVKPPCLWFAPNPEELAVEKLLPCPFCGGPAETIHHFSEDRWWDVVCGACAAQGPWAKLRDEAVRCWNKRK